MLLAGITPSYFLKEQMGPDDKTDGGRFEDDIDRLFGDEDDDDYEYEEEE